MESNKIARIYISWVSGSKIIKNSVYVVYTNIGTPPKTYLFDSLLDLPTTVFRYYMECLEKYKYSCLGQSFSKTTGSVKTRFLYDKTLKESWVDV